MVSQVRDGQRAMAEDTQQQRFVQACAAYQRDVALTQIDVPPGEARSARLADAIRRAAEECAISELQALHNHIAEVHPAAHTTLQRLRAWGLETHLRGALLPQHQEIQARQRSARCVVDEESIPLLASFTAMALETRRDRRAAIDLAVGQQLETINPLFEAQFKELSRVAEALGYASGDALWADILPVEPAAKQDEIVRVLDATREVYVDLLTWAVRRRLGVPLGQLQRHDILALFTFPEYQQYYQPGALIPSLQTCLHKMHIDPRADGRIIQRQCPPAFHPPATVAIQIPDEIVLTYSQVSGLRDAEAYAGAFGRALLWAYTSPNLPLPTRLLGDAAFSMSNAQLLAEMVALPGWLRHYLRVSVDENYWPWRRLDRLYRLRRQLGRFLYARHVATAESLAGAQEAYREIMMDACLVDYPPVYYLTDWDQSYTSLAFFRGWMVAYTLLEALRQHFADDWFRNPDSGTWLCEYWGGAFAEDVEEVPQHLAGVPWDVTFLAEVLINEEGW